MLFLRLLWLNGRLNFARRYLQLGLSLSARDKVVLTADISEWH